MIPGILSKWCNKVSIDKEYVYDFLIGLNIENDHIRAQVLGREPFPSLRQTYSHVQQEESRRNAMLTHSRSTMIPDSNQNNFIRGFTSLSEPRLADKAKMKCDYCGRTKHTRETCWQLHGCPLKEQGGKRMGFPRTQTLVLEITEDNWEFNSW